MMSNIFGAGPPPTFMTNPFDTAWTLLKSMVLKDMREDILGGMTPQELAQLPPEQQHMIVQGMVESGQLDPEMAQMLLQGVPSPVTEQASAAQPPQPPQTPASDIMYQWRNPPQRQPRFPK